MFELNGDASVVAFKDIKGRSAIIVDDFYKDPDEVRELALSLKYKDKDESALVGGFPGGRSFLDTLEVKEKLYNIYNGSKLLFNNLLISLAAVPLVLARLPISSATTAKPCPNSPALAASMLALKDRSCVLKTIS